MGDDVSMATKGTTNAAMVSKVTMVFPGHCCNNLIQHQCYNNAIQH
jgi:hypothetical protein